MSSVAHSSAPGVRRALDRVAGVLLGAVDVVAATLLFLDLLVVSASVLSRYVLNDPLEWADDVARELMVGSSFFGAAGAIARGENVGVSFFVDRLGPAAQRAAVAAGGFAVALTAGAVALYALRLGALTTGQTTGSGLPLEWGFYPMGAAGVCMAIFSLHRLTALRGRDVLTGAAVAAVVGLALFGWGASSDEPNASLIMLAGFLICLIGGMPIGFVLALSALLFVWIEGALPGVIFAQQLARGIDNFVLLAIPFFILVGYVMEANGMSVRIIALLERLVGRVRGGLNVVMVLAMVVFSGISGSKMADVAAVGSVLIPAARRSGQNPGRAVALLAASAVMA